MIRINLLKDRPAPVDRLPPALDSSGAGGKFLTKRETMLAIALVAVAGGVVAAQLSGVFDQPIVDDDEPLVAVYERPDPPPQQTAAPPPEPEPEASSEAEEPMSAVAEPTPEPISAPPPAPPPAPAQVEEAPAEFGAAPAHTVTAIRLVPWGEAIEILAEVGGEPEYSSFWVADPERLVIDIEDAELRAPAADLNQAAPHPLIRRVRAAQNSFEPARVRVVVETSRDGPVEISSTASGVSVKLSPAP